MTDIEYVTAAEYAEYKRTAEMQSQMLIAEDNRQNERIDDLEKSVSEFHSLAISVNSLATNMEHMVEELKAQGKRLDTIESRDGDMWRTVIKCIVTGVITLVVGFIVGQFLH